MEKGEKRRKMEAAAGFEPAIKDLQSSALPLGHAASGSTRLPYPANQSVSSTLSPVVEERAL